jgi:hypothetical protein
MTPTAFASHAGHHSTAVGSKRWKLSGVRFFVAGCAVQLFESHAITPRLPIGVYQPVTV